MSRTIAIVSLALLFVAAVPLVRAESSAPPETARRDVVVFVSAHPDDMAGSAGTALLLAEKFDVKVVDFTRGEAGLDEKGFLDGSTARRRMAEERKACRMLGTEPVFLREDNRDGRSYAGPEVTEELRRLFAEWKPRAVILHWPIDVHPDHVQSAAAAMHAISLAKIKPEIYFQNQCTQTRSFKAAYTVNVTRVKKLKDRFILCYECQGPEQMRWRKETDSKVQGWRIGVSYAETFGVWEGSVPSSGGVLDAIGAVK